MPINDLIGRPQMVDPVQRYGQGFATGAGMADVQTQRMDNVQQMNIRERKMDMLAREQQEKQQAEAMKRMEQYGTDIAPVIKDIMDMPDDKRSAAYQSKVSAIREIAASNGIDPMKAVSPTWDNDKATALVQKYYEEPDLGWSNIDPSKYTPESVSKYEKSGKRGDLVAVKKEGDSVNVYTGDQDALAKQLSKSVGAEAVKMWGQANDSVKSLESNNQAVEYLNSGMFTGMGANVKQQAAKLAQLAGFDVYENEVANGEAYYAESAKRVASIIKAFGSGTGLSDADREYAEKAAAGKITMTDKSLRRIIEMNQTADVSVINKWNDTYNKIPERSRPFDMSVQLPEIKNPSTSDQNDYGDMTPSEIEELKTLRQQQSAK